MKHITRSHGIVRCSVIACWIWTRRPGEIIHYVVSTFEGNLWSVSLVTGLPTSPSTSELETQACTCPGVQTAATASRTPALLCYGSVPFPSVSGGPGIVFSPGPQDSNSPAATSSFGSKWPQAVLTLWAFEAWHIWGCGFFAEKPLRCLLIPLGIKPSIRCLS